MSDIRVVTGEMDTISQGLEAGTDSLDGIGAAPVANAGESMALVAGAISRLAEASAGVSGGLNQSADDVRAAKDEYLRTDQSGADHLRGAGGH